MRRLRQHLTFANAASMAALFIALGGTSYAATGGNFLLGKSNSASSTTSLAAPVAGKGLQVTNTSTGAGATALGLTAASGHPPFTVNSGTKVANLNADKLDGIDSTGFLSSSNLRKLVWSATASSTATPETIATVGPYTIKGECFGLGGSAVTPNVRLFVNGPAGTVNSMFDETQDDDTDMGSHSTGLLIPASTDTEILSSGATSALRVYLRIGGMAMLKTDTGDELIQVDFNAVADNRLTPGSCFIQGSATMVR